MKHQQNKIGHLCLANYQSCGYRGLKQFMAVPIPSEMIEFSVVGH